MLYNLYALLGNDNECWLPVSHLYLIFLFGKIKAIFIVCLLRDVNIELVQLKVYKKTSLYLHIEETQVLIIK